MAQQKQPRQDPRHLSDEADIGSGEATPGQHDTEEWIRQIPPLPPRHDAPPPGPGRAPEKLKP
ncbi:hypothetical protein [Janthinobacterium agaricidamnosum]|uniref:Uncharacterized protein n=1 Tax=Janthinobacterium agaricidamnosum NBRC 102515 = DSM 9628 TaxID=1349767 RepID=W0V4U3_9BURK|nr:hypothetical protein [Janthinobacterium agaricidamnosum]CDG83849.1 hypothetical protein GJA_3230 [Janthinobacterium agaricidamnosum NBRC 102515 = DSM 9628]